MRPTINQYTKIGVIYAGLSESEVLENAHKSKDGNCFAYLEDGFDCYLICELHAPIQHWEEILKMGRKLSSLEKKALDLKKEIKEQKYPGIHITLDILARD